MSKAREFIDFWVENSVHAAEQFGAPGASQDEAELTSRLVAAAKEQGISETQLQAEVGEVRSYLRDKLLAANQAESARLGRRVD
ncbi:hypothetical protein SAMN05216338_108026 [Bradyrhizobium sp. Rc2d]|uniref:hypothetical protein n=1 Tax=Bradyrhizobium sp. Rc2d TaxID=1855321 RepID=UPI000881F5F7|nr:hypothetical protein [Bradyrhizobium sp. Rc2d]SDK01894.1 hypothetical protein SAMN05216338_108026 [Bradyrhizobium sp. Rc2d]